MMASLREVSRSARQILRASTLQSSTSTFRRCASSATAATPSETAPVIPGIETESGLSMPIVDRASASIQDPRKRASRRTMELPHSRYRYHPPKYYRGPLHPVQPPPSSDPVARDFAPGPFNLPRLKQTLHSTIAPDLMTLAYQHKIPGTPDKPERIRLRTWGDDSPYMENRPKRGPRGADVLLPLEPTLTYHNIPEIKSIHIAAFMPLARKNQDYVTVAKSVIQSITGVRPEATEVKHSESQWNIVKGDRSGVKVSVHGHQAYELLDKMISLVFPKIKEWKGISGTTGDSAGNLAWGFTPAQMILFPEVEANYSLYPAKMIPGCRVFVETTAKSDRHARLLLQSLGVPFYGRLID